MKLFKDFGVTALFGVLVICGSFIMLGLGIWLKLVPFQDILPMIGAWVGSVVSAYFIVKAVKDTKQ